jgi:hypothetical protein
MPPVTALAVWFVLHRKFVEKFVGADVIGMLRAADAERKAAHAAATPKPKRP